MKEVFAAVFGRLTKPGLTLSVSERRQAELLAKILLFILLFSTAVLFIVLFLNPHNDPNYRKYAFLVGGLVAFFTLSYGLNYNGLYKMAAYLLVTCAALTPWVSLMFDSSILEGDFVPLAYLAFSVLVSSILLPTTITIILAVLQISGLSFVFISCPVTPLSNWFSFLAFIILTSIFSILANNLIQNNLNEIESQANQLILSEAQLRELSNRDYLTGLYNRRYLEETLKREIHRAERGKHSLGIIMLDIDNFKTINDTLGHAAGDILLKEIGKFLANHVRQSDIACRYGGDEFVVFLADSSREVSKERAENMRQGVENLAIEYNNQLLSSVTISIGLANYPDSGLAVEQLLKAADSALYRAKQDGNNRVVVA